MNMTTTQTEIDLERFCAKETEHPSYEALERPWNAGGWRYASNAMICVRVPTTEPDDENKLGRPKFKDAARLFAMKGFNFAACSEPWPAPPYVRVEDDCPDCVGSGKLGAVRCSECGGEGHVTCTECGRDHECDECDEKGWITPDGDRGDCEACNGVGKRMVDTFLRVGEHIIKADLAKLIVSALPNVRWQPGVAPDRSLPFTFTGGQGLVMPCTAKGMLAKYREALGLNPVEVNP